MEFRILGSLEVRASSERLALGGPSEQKVLATLLLTANRVVSLVSIVDTLWENDPPATASKQAQNAVSRLRGLLAAAGEPRIVVTHGAGYRINVPDGSLDAQLFSAGVERAQACAARDQRAQAVEILRTALALWRGPALAGLAGGSIRASATAWDERRYAATETYYDHQLALARHREVLGELSALVAQHPLRERSAGQLMVALYRSGRQADALALYSQTRARLAAELGLNPGPELQRLQQQVLTADSALATPQVNDDGHSDAEGESHPPAQRQVPGATRHLTGRRGELESLAGGSELPGTTDFFRLDQLPHDV